MKEKKLTQEQRVLKFLKFQRRYVPIFELMDWGLKNYITEIKNMLVLVRNMCIMASKTIQRMHLLAMNSNKVMMDYLFNHDAD